MYFQIVLHIKIQSGFGSVKAGSGFINPPSFFYLRIGEEDVVAADQRPTRTSLNILSTCQLVKHHTSQLNTIISPLKQGQKRVKQKNKCKLAHIYIFTYHLVQCKQKFSPDQRETFIFTSSTMFDT